MCGKLILRILSNWQMNLSTFAYKTTSNFVLFLWENICQLGNFLACDIVWHTSKTTRNFVFFFWENICQLSNFSARDIFRQINLLIPTLLETLFYKIRILDYTFSKKFSTPHETLVKIFVIHIKVFNSFMTEVPFI